MQLQKKTGKNVYRRERKLIYIYREKITLCSNKRTRSLGLYIYLYMSVLDITCICIRVYVPPTRYGCWRDLFCMLRSGRHSPLPARQNTAAAAANCTTTTTYFACRRRLLLSPC